MGTGRRISIGIALGGACAVSGQIVLLRELLVVFHGNELSLGAVLGCWLFWGAAGSWLFGSRAGGFRHPLPVLAILFVLGSLFLPAAVFASALVKSAAGASPGETLGFFEFLPAVAILLAPLCFVMGSVFAVGARLLDELAPARNQVSRAYLLESAGAGAGGLLVSLLLLPHLGPLALSFLLGAVLLSVSFLLAGELQSRRLRVPVRIILLAMIAACAIAAACPQPDSFRRRVQWHGMNLLECRNSLLGNLAAIDVEGEVSLYENGLLVATSGYRMHAEELVHLGMVQHPDPRCVLLIGGGLGGSLREILRHPVERCDYVELDPDLLAMGRRHLLSHDLVPLSDPRVAVHHVDGRYFVKNAPRKYDVIMLDLPGPRSAQLNRFYSLEFYQEARRILRKDGILVFQVCSSEVCPTPEQCLLIASLRKTARLVFPHVAVLPGNVCYFVLSTGRAPVTDARSIAAALASAGVETNYLREATLAFRLSPWRAARLEEALARREDDARTNRDFRPLGYLYDLAQWAAQFPGPLRHWVGKVVAAGGLWVFSIPVIVFVLLAAGRCFWERMTPRTANARGADKAGEAGPEGRGIRPRDPRFILGAAVAVTGVSEIVYQVTVLVSFQVIHGYLFYRVGIMVAAFMVGLAAGSFWLWRSGDLSPARSWKWFLWVHVGVFLYPVFLPLLFAVRPPSVFHMALPGIAGLLGGIEFPLAVRLWRQHSGDVGKAAGVLYGLDLFGACAGAILVSPFLIPVVGIAGICWWTALLNAGTLLLLLTQKQRPKTTCDKRTCLFPDSTVRSVDKDT